MKYFFPILFSLLFISATAQEDVAPEWVNQFESMLYNAPFDTDRERSIEIVKEAIANVDTTSEIGKNYYAMGCAGLAKLFLQNGEYQEAENALYLALPFFTNSRENYVGYHQLLSVAGWLYSELRDYDKAIQYLELAKGLCELYLNWGREYVGSIATLSTIYMWKQEYLKAKIYADVARDFMLGHKDANTDDKLFTLNNIAAIYQSMKYYDDALGVLNSIIDIAKADPRCGYILPYLYDNFAVIYAEKGDFGKASSNIIKAYEYAKEYNYNDWPIMFFNLTFSTWKNNMIAESMKYSDEMATYLKEDAVNKFSYLDGVSREKYWERNNLMLVYANSMMLKLKGDSSAIKVYDNTLFSKGLLLRTSNHIKNSVYESGDTELINAFNEITLYQSRLAQNNVPRDSIAIIKLGISYIEKQIMSRLSEYADYNKFMSYTWKDIRDNLDKNEAAIEFVPIFRIPENKDTLIAYYAAAIIKKTYDEPRIIGLCSNDLIDSLTYRESGLRPNKFVNRLYNGTRRADLYEAIWSPLENELKGIKTIYYAPSGLLSSISFNALKVGNKCLSDIYDMRLVSSTSEIIELKSSKTNLPTNAVIYGGIKYDVSDDILLAEARGYSHETESCSNFRGSDLTRGSWGFLPGTKEEAETVNGTLKKFGISTALFEGESANEESFKALSHKGISCIHIATHGFFLQDPKDISMNQFVQNNYDVDRDRALSPMQLTGLLFAGANRAWKNSNVIPGIEDGILTADEISQIDLRGTEIVVLSACTTGLGEFGSPEGVFGLQRAEKELAAETDLGLFPKVTVDVSGFLREIDSDFENSFAFSLKCQAIIFCINLCQSLLRSLVKLEFEDVSII